MAKRSTTVDIERALINHFFLDKSFRFALEVEVYKEVRITKTGRGRVDFLANKGWTYTAIEVKISKADFKSKNGHNFVGHYNYYAVPEKLLDYAIENRLNDYVGIYVLGENGKLRVAVRARKIEGAVIDSDMNKKYRDFNMITACNSTIRRLYDKIKEAKQDVENSVDI